MTPYDGSRVTWCAYHSTRWGELVEQGWVTCFVEEWLDKPFGKLVRIATMIGR